MPPLLDRVRLRAIAVAYEELPSGPPTNSLSVASYEAFINEVNQQFGALPVKIEW